MRLLPKTEENHLSFIYISAPLLPFVCSLLESQEAGKDAWLA